MTEQQETYNSLDHIITKVMIKSERFLPLKRRKGWSPTRSKLIYKIRYFWLLMISNLGVSISTKTLERQLQ